MDLFPCSECPCWLGVGPACAACEEARRGTPAFVDKVHRLSAAKKERLERLRALGRTPEIALVGCGKAKRDGVHAARDLYVGTLFKWSLRVAERSADEIYVLSARHGLLRLDDRIESYDYSLYDVSLPARARWGHGVVHHLATLWPKSEPLTITMLAGAGYVAPILAAARDQKITAWAFGNPMAGMTLPERMRWFTAQ